MSVLICGSFAYDNIMVFQDRFKNHILPEKIHILNVAFLVPEMRREFGGCSGNIAYNLKLLGGNPVPMGTVGTDFSPYSDWLRQCKIDRSFVVEVDKQLTAQAYITTDLDDNQITAFHPGAMSFAHHNKVRQAKGAGISLGIVSPDGREGMLEHAREFAELGIPFVFDPGQGMPMFNDEEVMRFIQQATWMTVNDYEASLVEKKTGQTISQLAEQLEAIIVTRGSKGSDIYADGQVINIPTAKANEVLDPTGCGDAYRGGLLFGLENGYDWVTTGRIASLMGAIKVEKHGTQNHHFERDEFARRYRENFGEELNWS